MFSKKVERVEKKLEIIFKNKEALPQAIPLVGQNPYQVHAHIIPDDNADTSYIEAEIFIGQKMWLDEIQVLLPKIIPLLSLHSWCILEAAPGTDFQTIDDPVVCIGFRSDYNYWFESVGINQQNANILLPLSPKHILFTQVGKKQKAQQLDVEKSNLFREIIIRHADRYVF